MGRTRSLGLALIVLFVSGCLSIAITDPSSPSASSGIGFGEELFRLQGRVDYLYGHVLRNQQKLELQVGDLQRSIQSLEQGSEFSALRGDVLRLRDDLSQINAKMGSSSPVVDRNLKELIDRLYSQVSRNQQALELRISRLEETLSRIKSTAEAPALTPKVVGYSEGTDSDGHKPSTMDTRSKGNDITDDLNGR